MVDIVQKGSRVGWLGTLCAIGLLSLCACSTAEKPEVVALADSDRDGVPDPFDSCVDTLVPQPVNDHGCAIITGSLAGVDFAADSADLGRSARAALDDFLVVLKQYPDVVVAIDGHTDNRGSGIRNLELSKARVIAVVRYLVARGVAPGRLRPFGFGEARPLVSNATADGRQKNRRIEVSVVVPEFDNNLSSDPADGSN